MPRKARTQSGAPGQAPVAMQGQTYGEGKAAVASQKAAPPIDVTSRPAVPAGGGPPSATTGGGGSGEMDAGAMQKIQDFIQGMTGSSVLKEPTNRPTESVLQPLGVEDNFKRPMVNDALYELRALAQRFPYPDLLNFLDRVEREA